MLNKRAISPVVATALLLVVAVVAVVGFQGWFTTFSSNLFTKTETQSSSSIGNTQIESVQGYSLYFKNGNTENISINKIKVGDSDCNISGNYSNGISEIDLGSCLNNLTSKTQDVVVYTNNGIYSEKVYLKEIVVRVYSSCTLDGATVAHLGNYLFYNTSTVPFGGNCTLSSLTRNCFDGTYSGNSSYQYASCSVVGQDITPNAFNFTNQTGVNLSTIITSNTLIPTGYEGSVSVGITGNGSPELSVAGGAWTSSTTITLGQNLTIRLNSSSSSSTTSVVNLTFGNYSTLWNVTTKLSCSSLGLLGGQWITVPGNSGLGTSDFCVMKFEAKNVGSVATSQAALTPWVTINLTNAKNNCTSLGVKYHLPTNAEWTTVARNVESVNGNWNSSVVGSGIMFSGHNDGGPNSVINATLNDSDGYYGTNDGLSSPGDSVFTNYASNDERAYMGQKRILILNNSEIIWDFSGNAYEFTNETCVQGDPWYNVGAWVDWTDANVNGQEKTLAGPLGSYTRTNGTGAYYGCISAGNSFIHGGMFSFGQYAGLYSLVMDQTAAYTANSLGYRCAYTP